MRVDRVNAFTDGVLAIVITIMVLELHVPSGEGFEAIRPALPLLGAYALSFVNIGIFWNNHHHMMHSARKIDGSVLWANLFLLFCLSLVPFVIRRIGEAGISVLPVGGYGVIMIVASIAYLLLERALTIAEGEELKVREAVGTRFKEWLKASRSTPPRLSRRCSRRGSRLHCTSQSRRSCGSFPTGASRKLPRSGAAP